MTASAEPPLTFYRRGDSDSYESAPAGYEARYLAHRLLRPWQLLVNGSEVGRHVSFTAVTVVARRHKEINP